jgi:uncharacterized ion transporter superfamily protein YfcC
LSNHGVKVGKRTFISAVLILACLIIIAGVLTHLVPGGEFQREIADGREIIVPGTFRYTEAKGLPVWRWFTAPVEVLWGPDSLMIISIILFILIIGGAFAILDETGVLAAAIGNVVAALGHRKYLLLGIITLFFMLFGSLLGILEEIVPLVPLAVALAWSLGWDSLTGLGMSLLATGFGFAAGISNPFSIGVAQRIANLPPFSGAGFRAGVFVLVYLVLMVFLVRHAKRVEKNPQVSPVWQEDAHARATEGSRDLQMAKAEKASLIWFACTLLAILGLIITASQIPGLSDYTMPLVALLFLIGGLGAGLLAKRGWKVFQTFARGAMGILPGTVLILMAMSVKYIITSGGIMDTVLHQASEVISQTSAAGASLLIYVVVLVLNFFIGSATAKAFLVMPLITPLADLVGVTRQVAVLAFAFGDGFSNVLYPTNPVLLIALGLTVVSYPKWFRWVIGLQLAVLALTALLLLAAVAINLGPF